MPRVASAGSLVVVAALSSSLAVLAMGCGGDAQPASYLGNLRLHATRSEPAEVSSRQQVTVEALTVDGAGPVATGVTPGVSVEWHVCEDLGHGIDDHVLTMTTRFLRDRIG